MTLVMYTFKVFNCAELLNFEFHREIKAIFHREYSSTEYVFTPLHPLEDATPHSLRHEPEPVTLPPFAR